MIGRKQLTSPIGAVVLGIGTNGVGVLHSLASTSPTPAEILGIDSSPQAVGFSSRIGEKHLLPDPAKHAGHALADALIVLAKGKGRRFALLPCSDDYVLFVSRHREALREHFEFLLPDAAIVEALLDKQRFDALARAHRFPVPKTTTVIAKREVRAPRGFTYPLVLKPLTTLKGNPIRAAMKVRNVSNDADWRDVMNLVGDYAAPLLVQECIPGEDTAVLFYGALWVDGRPVCEFTGRKLRQFRKQFGSTTRAVTVHDEDLIAESRAALRAIQYQGLVDVEFKRDDRTGALKLIEINPRQGLWHRLGASVHRDLIAHAFSVLSGATPIDCLAEPGLHGHWSYLARDLVRLRHDLQAGFAGLPEWIASYRQLPVDALFSWRDPRPWFTALWRLVADRGVHHQANP